MKLKNVLIVVNDIERSRKYYHDLFGLEMVLDNDGNMILTEGLVLQDAKIWISSVRISFRKAIPANSILWKEIWKASSADWRNIIRIRSTSIA